VTMMMTILRLKTMSPPTDLFCVLLALGIFATEYVTCNDILHKRKYRCE
jgi:hypothetical protein